LLPFSVLPFLLAVVALQRLAELVYSGRTRRLLRASGARKVRPDGMTLLVLAHVAWFVGCWWEARRFGLAFDWWTGLGLDLFVVGDAGARLALEHAGLGPP
jgi:isoprenylcysteine carboxyl methyltransferase (ICMT) family protein YpbQ